MNRQIKIHDLLKNNKIIIGASSSTFSPSLVEMYGTIELDFVWLDFEHSGPSPYDSNIFENLLRAATIHQTSLLVRLPSGDPPLVRKVLDTGVRNILIPQIKTPSEVEDIVNTSRFKYEGYPGKRGIGAARASQWGADLNTAYVDREDTDISVGVMIENKTAVDNIEGILSIPELDFVFVGPADLSVSLGSPLQYNSEEIRGHIRQVLDAAQENGMPVGTVARTKDDIEQAIHDGYEILYIGDEISSAREVITDRLHYARNSDNTI